MRPALAVKKLRLTIEPTTYAISITKRGSDMDVFPGNLRVCLQQLQRLIEPRGIGWNIGKIGNRGKREELIGQLISRNMLAIAGL